MTVHIRQLSSASCGEIVMGGENQQPSLNQSTGYSETAKCAGKPSYLEPISGSLQKSIEGVYRIGVFRCQWHVGKATRIYLDRIRDSLQKPLEGLSYSMQPALYKGAIEKNRATVPS